MSEFGHFCSTGGSLCVDSWGAGPFIMLVDGQAHRFEDSDRFGPYRLNKDGSESKHTWWPERHRFWIAHRAWVAAGRQLEADGVICIWDEPKPTVVRRLSRRNVLVIVEGDEDGALVDEAGIPI